MLSVLYYSISEAKTYLQIEIEDETIQRISFCEKPLNTVVEGDFEHEIIRQFYAYFTRQSCEFDLPFFATGSSFQLQVWEATLQIPYGHTLSYAEIAVKIGKPEAARAVGMALNANPVPILIPCHRVLGSDGSLKGYSGGIELKRYLLGLEHNGSSNS